MKLYRSKKDDKKGIAGSIWIHISIILILKCFPNITIKPTINPILNIEIEQMVIHHQSVNLPLNNSTELNILLALSG